jgi:ATP-binding cassette subfamily F protein 3
VDWLRFQDLERSYGARVIFENLSGVLRDGNKVGLVGPNGSGKSSLIRILAGIERPESGEVLRGRDARLGYVGQAASEQQHATLRTIFAHGFSQMHEEEATLRRLERELTEAFESGNAEREAAAMHDYGEAREAFDRHGGEGLEHKMLSMMAIFGFVEDDLDRDANMFSGGQRTRVALARMLVEEPDFLILDEPTNHLDLQTVRWLEDFLRDDPRALIVVSHDRYFLDRVANEIWELDGGILTRYEVGKGAAYSAYIDEKAERAALAVREYENYLTETKRRKNVIAELRTHGSHNYSHVRSREKQFAKIEPVSAPKTSQQQISVKLQAVRSASNGLALNVHHITKSFDKPLFSNLSFQIVRGERLAIVGPNGAGKSSLLHILNGTLSADKGHVEIMSGVRTANFSQDAADQLPAGMTAVDAVLEGSRITEEFARGLLGRLGLSGDAGDKRVEEFSGGERRRIMLARLMAQDADCLFLDEPTNDLDIPSREALEEVLASYGGAIVVISHDRYLLGRLAEKILWIRNGEATMLDQGYESYEKAQHAFDVLQAGIQGAGPVVAEPPPKSAPATNMNFHESKEREKAIAASEREVAKFDAKKAKLELLFADPNIYDDPARYATLKAEFADLEKELARAYARWEELLLG